MLKKILAGSALAVILLVAILLARTLIAPGARAIVLSPPAIDASSAEARAMADRLGAAIRIETVSWGDRAPDAAAFGAFADFLERSYPAAHAAMTREIVNGYSLVYRWKGTGEGAPVGFIAHSDVVPVEPGSQESWTHPPFSGALADGAVWGRGAMDNKGQLIAMMEAAERLAAAGFAPSTDVYFLFGHDEEVGGVNGAGRIRDALDARGVHFAFTLDEGSGLVQGVIAGVAPPVALISTAEKGSTTLKFTAHGAGGHSSAPGKDTAISTLARAVLAVNDAPFAPKIDADMAAFLGAIAPHTPFAQRVILSNLWLTRPLVAAALAGEPTTAAALRTTTAATLIEGGVKVNVLPQSASAVVNYRIHPRDSVAGVKARAERQVEGLGVDVEALGGVEPSPRSSAKSAAYDAISRTTSEVFGAVPIAPFLTLQGTDTRHYIGAADDNYRFTPFIYAPDDLERIHGTDERLKIVDLARAVSWYEAFIRQTAS
ncbi:MAG: M20/M25/M40 family metallo-hydrolase [Parvularculaceae bacterium]|nr:M20/M25/M40 family metallo-hydrolase [Parvularculaceae bacterium]